jgi:hypothetical protein
LIYFISIEEESKEDEEDDKVLILPVKNTLDHGDKHRRLIAYFDNGNETIHNFNKIEI